MKNENTAKATLAPVVFVSSEALKEVNNTKAQRNPNDLIIMNAEVSRNGQKYAFIPVSEIDIDMTYQREQTERATNKLIANWNEERYEPIKVAYRDGRFKAWDGGKRLRAQIKMGRENVYCRICDFETIKDEINSFIRSGECVTKIKPKEMFKAKLFLGEEQQVTIKKICDKYGISIEFDKSHGMCTDRKITNISQIEKMFSTIGEKGLDWVFDTIHEMTLDAEGKQGCNTILLRALGVIYSKPIDSYNSIQKALHEFALKHSSWHSTAYRVNAKREYPMLEDVSATVNLLESIVVGKTTWAKN